MSHHIRKSLKSQVILSLAPGYLKSLWKVEQLHYERLRATHPQRPQGHSQDIAEEAGDHVGFPRGVKQLALRHPHPARVLSPGHSGTSILTRPALCPVAAVGGERAPGAVC